jgi:hypothetical protein
MIPLLGFVNSIIIIIMCGLTFWKLLDFGRLFLCFKGKFWSGVSVEGGASCCMLVFLPYNKLSL